MKTPLRILSLGAGVQSSTVLRMAIHGEIEPIDHAIFADTGWESKAVYGHLKFLRAEAIEAGIGFHIVQAKPGANIRADALRSTVRGKVDDEGRRRASMPYYTQDSAGSRGIIRRQCTQEYKLEPIRRLQRQLAGVYKKRCRELAVVTILGISVDEMQRMKSSVEPWQTFSHPLVDLRMDRLACIEWNRKHGYPDPPRSACIGCPFHSDREWRDMQKNRPEEFADAVEFDASIRKTGGMRGDVFLHRSCKPLDQIDFRTDADRGQLDMFQQECLGLCGD